MLVGDSEAGRAAVECLIEQGKLVPDFWFRVEDHHKDHSSWDNSDTCRQQVANAVKFALGAAGVGLPDWARSEHQLPDTTWIPEYDQAALPTAEPYYTVRTLQEAFKKCNDLAPKEDDGSRDKVGDFRSISLRTWRRIIPHFRPETSEQIIQIENWPERGYRGHSKSYEIEYILSGVMIRDEVFREFYDRQQEEGLRQIFHGIGKKAVLGVGAMLFLSGEHDDLMYTAEQLSDELSSE